MKAIYEDASQRNTKDRKKVLNERALTPPPRLRADTVKFEHKTRKDSAYLVDYSQMLTSGKSKD